MNGFPQIPIGQLCEINPRPAQHDPETLVSFVPMAAVDERHGAISAGETRRLAEVSKGYTAFRDGDVLFAKITPCMQNGKAAIARGLSNGIGRGSTEFFVLRPTRQVLSDYLFYIVRRTGFRERAQTHFTGTAGQQRVPKSFIENERIPLPPLDEQRRIVAILNRAARIERLRARAAERLREFVPALFVRMFGDPLDNPMRWPLAPLGDICAMDRHPAPIDTDGSRKLPFVGLENIGSGTGTFNFDTDSRTGTGKSAAFRFNERHVLYGKLRPYLNKVATPDFTGRCSTEVVPLIPRKGTEREFVASLLRQDRTVQFVMDSVTGSRMPRTDMKVLMSMPVPLPPLSEQHRFAAIVQRATAATAVGQRASDAAAGLTASLMDRLLGETG